MQFTLKDGLNILIPALAQFREQMVTEKYPEIVFPQFVTIDSSGGRGLMEKMHFSVESASDLDDGLVGDKTTSIDTVEVDFTPGSAAVVSWAKGVTYTLRELEICARLKIDVNTEKMRVLRQNADQTLQKVAFLGHARDTRIKGLLNSDKVEAVGIKGGKPFAEGAADENAAALIDMFTRVLTSTDLIAAPDTLAIPMLDYVTLGSQPRGEGRDTTVLKYVTDALAGIAGKPVNLKPIPLKLADKAGNGGKKRALAYINDAQHVVMDIPSPPEVLDVQPKGLLAWQTGIRMDFGGVTFLEPQSAKYIDY